MLLDYYMKKLDIDTMPVFLKKYLDTKCIRRLKYITYLCGMDYASKDIYDFSEPITRFDHSLTTSLLVWKYTLMSSSTGNPAVDTSRYPLISILGMSPSLRVK